MSAGVSKELCPCRAPLQVCPCRVLGSPDPPLLQCGEVLPEYQAKVENIFQAVWESLWLLTFVLHHASGSGSAVNGPSNQESPFPRA